MLPQLTPVNWAIIIGTVVSSATLLLVSFDLYLSHFKTKRSEVSLRVSQARTEYIKYRNNETNFNLPCNFVNTGKRSAVIRAKAVKLRFEPSGEVLEWSDLQGIDPQDPYVATKHIDNHSVPAESTVEATLKFGTRDAELVETKIEDSERLGITYFVDVEDNEGHYDIELEHTFDLSD